MKLHLLATVVLLGSSALAQLPVQDRPPCTSRLPFPAGAAAGAVAGGKAFFATGPDVLVYDEASGAWSVEAGVLSEQGASAAAAVGDLVFFAGGFSVPAGVLVPDGLVHIHDAASGAWSTEALSVPRAGLAAASTATHVYFAGGSDASFRDRDVVDVYEVATGSWSTASLSVARSGLSGVAVGDLVLFAGGSAFVPPGPAPVYSDRVDVLDTTTGTWSTANLSQPRTRMAAAAAGGRALFAGGVAGTVSQPLLSDRVDLFDLASGTWSTASLPSARYAIHSATVGTRSFFIGGVAGPGGFLGRGSSQVDEYDAATGLWAHARLSEPALFPGTAGLSDRVLVAGGYRWTPGFLQPSLSSVVDVLPASLPRSFCEGDAGCPCANAGSGGGGCGNSVGGGARLSAQRCPLVDDQRPRFWAEALPKGELAILFTGTSTLAGGASFGDGLRCVGGTVRRLVATQSGDDGGVDLSWLAPALVDWSPGDVRFFQLYHRDPAGPCGQGFNTSQGIEIEF